ncbi:MAG: AMP-binding protein, partial [Erysipelotrichaceae bacterium]|nr:AMP-binding protein [Erysipelotrichaceae bacterium]
MNNDTRKDLLEVAERIHELREISGYSVQEMAQKTDTSEEEYLAFESGKEDLPFSFIHKCALTFKVEITDLMTGSSSTLRSYEVTRGKGTTLTSNQEGKEIWGLAAKFSGKFANPYYVKYSYSAEEENAPLPLVTHQGQEFNLVLKGQLKVQVGEHSEILNAGDSIFFKSSSPHGEMAVGGQDCEFLSIVMDGKDTKPTVVTDVKKPVKKDVQRVWNEFIDVVEDDNGALQSISFKGEDEYNFAFDVVDKLAQTNPDKLAMIHLDKNKVERRFTFYDMRCLSNRAANYFKSLGIHKGSKVMLVLRRNWQFWPILVALDKIGAIAIPATDQLLDHDFEYRFKCAGVDAVLCSADSNCATEADKAILKCPLVKNKIIVNGAKEGWKNFDEEFMLFRSSFEKPENYSHGNDPMVMFFTSGTTGYPKMAAHSNKYTLGHFITAKYW